VRLIQNEIQAPKKLVSPEDRRTPAFKLLTSGVIVMIAGASVFFGAFIFRNSIDKFTEYSFRTVQTYGLAVAFLGILLYIFGASKLKISVRNTTYYKVKTIVKDELYDPKRNGDFTRTIQMRLSDLSDEWSLMTQIKPEGSATLIPQVINGPHGVFALWPLGEHPERKAFKDPAPEFKRAAGLLEENLKVDVTPLMVFSTPKVMGIYKKRFNLIMDTVTLIDLEDFLQKKRKVFGKDQIAGVEEKLFNLIKGTPPGESFWGK